MNKTILLSVIFILSSSIVLASFFEPTNKMIWINQGTSSSSSSSSNITGIGTVGFVTLWNGTDSLNSSVMRQDNGIWINGSFYPEITLNYNLGSGAYRWFWLYVANISAENIDVIGTINANIMNLTTTYSDSLFVDTINASYIYNHDFEGYMDLRGNPWFLGGADLEIDENLIVNGNVSVNGQSVCLSNGSNCPSTNNITGGGASNRLAYFTNETNLLNTTIFYDGNRTGFFDSTPDAFVDINNQEVNTIGLIVQGVINQNTSILDIRSYLPEIFVRVAKNGTLYYAEDEVCTNNNSLCEEDYSDRVLNTTLETYYYNMTYIDGALATTFYNVTNITVIAGTGSGTLANINIYDNIPYNITEVLADVDVNLTVSNVTSFNQLVIRYKTSVGEVHSLQVYLYDNDLSSWESYDTLSNTDGVYIIRAVSVFDYSDHIINDSVKIRLFVNDVGLNSVWNFDWITVSKGVSSQVGTELDPLSIHRNGDVPLTANWAANYNITGTQLLDAIDQRYNDTLYCKGLTDELNLTKANIGYNPFDQSLNTTDDVTFNELNIGSSSYINENNFWYQIGDFSTVDSAYIEIDPNYFDFYASGADLSWKEFSTGSNYYYSEASSFYIDGSSSRITQYYDNIDMAVYSNAGHGGSGLSSHLIQNTTSLTFNGGNVCTDTNGLCGGNPFDQSLNTTDNVTFANITMSGVVGAKWKIGNYESDGNYSGMCYNGTATYIGSSFNISVVGC